MIRRFFGGSEPAAPPAVPGYRLECPRQDELLSSLTRVAGAERAESLWREACAAERVPAEAALDLPDLQRVIERIEARTQGDTAGVIAGAFGIRLRSYLLLSRLRGHT